MLFDNLKAAKEELKGLEAKLRECERSKLQVKQELSALLEAANEDIITKGRKLTESLLKYNNWDAETKAAIQGLMETNESLDSQLGEKNKVVESLSKEANELRIQVEQLQLQTISHRKDESRKQDEIDLQQNILERLGSSSKTEQLIRKLQLENQNLKQQASAIGVFEERLHDMQMKLDSAKDLQGRLAKLEAENAQLTTSTTSSDISNALNIGSWKALKNLMEKVVETTKLKEDISELRGSLGHKELEFADAKAEVEHVTKQLETEKKCRLEAESRVVGILEKLKLQSIEIAQLKEALSILQQRI